MNASMNISGTPLVSPNQKPEDHLLALRLNQRITAEVLQVAGEQVTLAVQGVRIVAKLTSADQSAALIDQKIAHFIVRDLAGPLPNLQLVRPGSQPASSPLLPPADLAARILHSQGLAVTPDTLQIARSLLGHNLTVTPELVKELTDVLAASGAWDAETVNLAAWIKSEGLPLSPGTLSLALKFHNGLGLTETLTELKGRLQGLMTAQSSSPLIKEMAENSIRLLNDLILQWDASPGKLEEMLHKAVRLLGNPLEHELAELVQKGIHTINDQPLEDSLLTLIALRQELAKHGNSTVDSLDRFLDTLRWTQFTNSDPQSIPAKGQWLNLDFPLQGQGQPAYQETHLRVACQQGKDGAKVDPGYTRLVIQMDMKNGEMLEIDLSVVQKQIGAQITASSPQLRELAESELDQLSLGIERVGYQLQSARCTVGQQGSTLVKTRPPAESNQAQKPVDLDA